MSEHAALQHARARQPLANGWKRYVFAFVDHHVDFRMAELDAVARMFDVKLDFGEQVNLNNPYMIIDVLGGDAQVKLLLDRLMCLSLVAELWGQGRSYDECLQHATLHNSDIVATVAGDSFKFIFDSFNRKVTGTRRNLHFQRLTELPLTGKVDLDSPQHVHCVLEDYGASRENIPKEPYQLFIGRVIGHGQRHLIKQFDLKKRKMLGNTSMDPELSFIQANIAQARPGTLLMDPFVGTASLLIPCAHFGSFVTGSDISFQVIHGIGKTSRSDTGHKFRKPDENIRATFEQYKLEKRLLDLLVADNSNPSWLDRPLFDAIVTDPPYGIREKTRRIGRSRARDDDSKEAGPDMTSADSSGGDHSTEHTTPHFPRSERYSLGSVYDDLLTFASHRLVMGGRLVFWIPEALEHPFIAPEHPCLELVSASQQTLTRKLARRLLAYVKTCEPTEELLRAERTGLAETWDIRAAVFSTSATSAGRMGLSE